MQVSAIQNVNISTGTISRSPSFNGKYTSAEKCTNKIDQFLGSLAKEAETREKKWQDGLLECSQLRHFYVEKGKLILLRKFPARIPSGKYCLFLHGVTSSISNYQNLILHMMFNNINIITMEYPGYGEEKDREPNYKNIMLSSEEIVKQIFERYQISPEHLSIVGYSLGGQIAANIAANINFNSLFLVNPLTHFSHLNKSHTDSKGFKPSLIRKLINSIQQTKLFNYRLNDKMNAFKDAEKIKCPIYVLSSDNDTVIDSKYIEMLVDTFRKTNKNIIYEKSIESGHKFSSGKVKRVTALVKKALDVKDYYEPLGPIEGPKFAEPITEQFRV